jgi:glycosyltransferase involved in cell wall biosynthesis
VATDAPDVRATLGAPLPGTLEVGRGNAIAIEGSAVALRARIVDLRLRVGQNEASVVTRGVPAPGELTGTRWWSAVVPVAPVAAPGRVPAELHVRLNGGREAIHELGQVRLEPGSPAGEPDSTPAAGAATGTPGLIAICLATCDPPLELLRRQIESIRSQTHTNWICSLSDDCSPPDKWREVVRLVGGDERFHLARADERAGLYLNFERALRLVPSTAEYVAFADQDDRWDDDKLETLLGALGERDALVHSDARVVSADGEPISPTFWPRGAPRHDSLGELLLASAVTGASCLFRRSVLDWALPFPPPVGETYHDRWIALVSSVLGGIAFVDRPLYDYVQHPASALGHAGATEPGRRRGESRLVAIRRRYADLRRRRFHPNWRSHDSVLIRSVQEAEVLRLRLGERMSPVERRAVARIARLPTSPAVQARVLVRHLARAPRRRPGREGALARAIAWRRLVRMRSLVHPEPAMPSRGGTGKRSRRPLRVGITVTRDSKRAAYGDLHIARELGGELRRLGFDVINLEVWRAGWRRHIGSVDVVISLLDAFPLDQMPQGIVSIAWVRNWTERWIDRRWFGDYDLVFASSEHSRRLIEERSSRAARLMPLATNPDRFRPTAPDPRLQADLVFTGNHWGAGRQIEEVLPVLAADMNVKVFGRGWDAVPGMDGCRAGALEYERLPTAYSSARVVIDDSGHHTRPYGAVNSRVFDALACGTLVVSNDAEGVRALFDDQFPVWADAPTLRAQVESARRDPEWAERLVERYRAEVLARNTYRHRARQLRDAFIERLEGAADGS